jgi:hypothetical protein
MKSAGIGIGIAIVVAIGFCRPTTSIAIATPIPMPTFVACCLYFRNRHRIAFLDLRDFNIHTAIRCLSPIFALLLLLCPGRLLVLEDRKSRRSCQRTFLRFSDEWRVALIKDCSLRTIALLTATLLASLPLGAASSDVVAGKIYFGGGGDATTETSVEIVFPHIADGGGYRTVLLLTNSSSGAATAELSLFSNTGDPLQLTVDGWTASQFSVPIPARGSVRLTTSGQPASTQVGWAKVTASSAVDLNGNAIFQYFNGTSLFCEASVPVSPPVRSVEFYVDEEGGFITGLALANPTTLTAEGTLTLWDGAGKKIKTHPISVPPLQHTSAFLYQLLDTVAGGIPSGRAQIDLTSGYISAAALRFHTSWLFSTLSVGQPGYALSASAALFSPGGGVRSRIIAEIDRAQSTIDIAIYSFTADAIRDALISARNRGLAIRIIADSSQADGLGAEIATLERMGFQVKRTSGVLGGIMHNKYMIIDGKLLVTGSYNWSASAEDNNYENAVFVQGSSLVQKYADDFDRIWSK